MATSLKKLQVFSISAHIEGHDEVDYFDLFQKIRQVPTANRLHAFRNRQVAIPQYRIDNTGLLALIAYEGEVGVNPLIYDTQRASARIEQLRANEILAEKTHGLIDITNREAIIAYNHKGAKAGDIAEVCENVAQNQYHAGVQVIFSPVVEQRFIEQLRSLRRVRLAYMKMGQPNPGWTDEVNSLAALGQESRARYVDVEVVAQPRDTLPGDTGIVAFIKSLVRRPNPAVMDAHVIGSRDTDDGEVKISIENFIQSKQVRVQVREGGVDDIEMDRYLREFMAHRRARRTS